RNIIDRSKPEVLNLKVNSLIGEVTLAIFLSMALMSINLGEISGNVLPIIVALILQIALMAIFASTILFRLLGKDYDSAIMVAGFIGHELDATLNAIANMHSVTQQHGMSHKALLIVPIVGAFLIEVLTVPIILATINLFSYNSSTRCFVNFVTRNLILSDNIFELCGIIRKFSLISEST